MNKNASKKLSKRKRRILARLKKANSSKEKGEERLFDEIRYLFYITNDRQRLASRIVFGCNDRCNQENLIAQLAAQRALHAPVDNLRSNWATLLMTSLAWTLSRAMGALSAIFSSNQRSRDQKWPFLAH